MLHWPGMRLAPGVFMRADVGRFAKVGGARILPWDQVSHVQPGSGAKHRCDCGRCDCWRFDGKDAGERIDPCAGADEVLVAI